MIYQFRPILKSTPWGGDRISRLKGMASGASPIGESWELSTVEGWDSVVESGPCEGLTLSALIERDGVSLLGRRVYERYDGQFPITVKFLDAREWLSLQVHPDDEIVGELEGPRCQGKTEMWHVIEARAGSQIIAGFKPGTDREAYLRAEGSSDLLDLVRRHDAAPGRDFYIEAGVVHALGAGCFVAEVAQNSDFTYRVYDYGRRRELHFEKARRSMRFDGPASLDGPVGCFKVDARRVSAGGEMELEPVEGSFQVVMVLKGNCEVDGVAAPAGRTLLISADHGSATLRSCAGAEFLIVSV